MIIGCLFAVLAAAAPREAFILLWIFTDLVQKAFNGWFVPLVGLIFLPFTTLLYTLVLPTNFWGWLVVLMGLVVDARQYMDAYENRSRVPAMSGAGA